MKHAPALLLLLLAGCWLPPANTWPDDHDNDASQIICLPSETDVPGRFRAAGDVPNSYARGLERGNVELPADTHLQFACEKQPFFSDAALKQLATLPRMRLAEIHHTPGLTVAGLGSFANMKKLSLLRLIDSVQVNDGALEQIAAASSLESLTLGPCSEVTDSGLARLGKLKHLRVLVIYDYPKLTEQGFDSLQRSLPQLQVFKYREMP